MTLRHSFPILALLAFVAVSLSGCVKDACNMTYKHAVYSPVQMPHAEFVNAVEVISPRDVVNPGKIYVKDNILLVNEIGEGVHVFDNKNPQNPQPLSFISVPGNYDMSTNCDKLYLDSSMDLLIFDISDASAARLINRVENALPHQLSFRGYQADATQGVVVKWKEEIREDAYDCQAGIPALWQENQVNNTWNNPTVGNTRTINPAVPGKSGSMSRFSVLDDYLYVVTPEELKVFNATNCDQPQFVSSQNISANFGVGEAEMITTLNNLLLIGSTGGMSIFSTENPTNPAWLSTFEHVRACDPVTAQDNYAYVTLRNSMENPCGPFWNNQLDVIDISNPQYPRLIHSFNMYNPHGLGIDGDVLFIADGTQGLKVFDASSPTSVGKRQIAHFPEMDGYDVIAANGVLTFVGKDGIAQYDYSDVEDIQLLSTIPVLAQ